MVVLGLLCRKPMHGYEIFTFTTRHGLSSWLRVKKPSVYKALQRLEKSGHISGEMIISENHPPRKVYQINPIGSAYFLELLEAVLVDDNICNRPDFWNAMRFVHGNLTKDHFVEIIRLRKSMMDKWHLEIEEKFSLARERGEFEGKPFIFGIVHKQFKKFSEVEYQTLLDLEAAAVLEENQKDFAADEK